jgi:hypothetical protein
MRLLTLWKLDPPPSTGKIPVDPQARRLVADGRAINVDCLNKLVRYSFLVLWLSQTFFPA